MIMGIGRYSGKDDNFRNSVNEYIHFKGIFSKDNVSDRVKKVVFNNLCQRFLAILRVANESEADWMNENLDGIIEEFDFIIETSKDLHIHLHDEINMQKANFETLKNNKKTYENFDKDFGKKNYNFSSGDSSFFQNDSENSSSSDSESSSDEKKKKDDGKSSAKRGKCCHK
jgi:hypothetical protein